MGIALLKEWYATFIAVLVFRMIGPLGFEV